ncbi:DUF1015 family protein [Nocardioides marmotae]|uniref:DUF1015 family protein n=1 Tax=Nocardioides marmotae TaxID=2663857 RepID=UPI0012B5D75A|nr:DUF1015 family protein [Nocardioides marmotae]MBC9735475.1 DUF1015 family protein [Nocardioides marmotae]MTB86572.1 DUF1015 family protein [Nocardioides marmotae]
MDPSAVVTPPYVGGPFALAPFHGLMLAPRRIGDPASARVLARPYDTVPERLRSWEASGQLLRDEQAALYLHEYTAGGITVRGLVGSLDVSRRAAGPGEAVVLPHEGIHPAQADELADRMTQMQLNPAPILLVHHGRDETRRLLSELRSEAPVHDFTDRARQQHRIWAIRDPDRLATLTAELAGTRALIADGHHRYSAYLRLQRRAPGTAYDRGLAMLVDQDDTPLFLGAIHRLLAGSRFEDVRAAAETVGIGFAELTHTAAVEALGPDTLVATDQQRWAALAVPSRVGRLAVEALHEQLVPALPRGPHRIDYLHSAEEALAAAGTGTGTAVLVPAPPVDTVLGIVAAGRLLPQKATSFQPKPSVGVLIRSLLDG